MSLAAAVRQTESARTELSKAGRDADGWSDDTRARFDKQRIQPLDKAGSQLQAALARAAEQVAAAEKLLSDRTSG
jgi:hypothetical protein